MTSGTGTFGTAFERLYAAFLDGFEKFPHDHRVWHDDQSIDHHLYHASEHIRLAIMIRNGQDLLASGYTEKDATEDHLGHALARILFAIQLDYEERLITGKPNERGV